MTKSLLITYGYMLPLLLCFVWVTVSFLRDLCVGWWGYFAARRNNQVFMMDSTCGHLLICILAAVCPVVNWIFFLGYMAPKYVKAAWKWFSAFCKTPLVPAYVPKKEAKQ